MKKIITTMLFAGLMSGVTTSQAELSANVALTSDYIWRGITQSANDPALQAGLDYAHSSGLYVGTWGSNVDFWEPADTVADPTAADNGEDIEIDVYAGYSSKLGNFGYDVGVIQYIYPGTNNSDVDFVETYVGVSFLVFNVKASYSDDYLNSGASAWYMEGRLDYEFSSGYALAVHAGKADGSYFSWGGRDTVDYSIGVSKDFSGYVVDFTYSDTDLDGANEDTVGANQNDDAAFVLSVSKSFDIF